MLFDDANAINRKNGETMYWRFLREGETNHNEFNIWPIMKSKTMREYYKNNIKLSTEAIISIIVNSYIDMDYKIKWLNDLIHYCIKKGVVNDIKLVENVLQFYIFMKKILYESKVIFPNNNVIFALRRSEFKYNNFIEYGWNSYIEKDSISIFDEFQPCETLMFYKDIHTIVNYIKENYTSQNYMMFYIDTYIMCDNNIELLCTYDIKFIDKSLCINISSSENLYKGIICNKYHQMFNKSLVEINSYINAAISFYIPYDNEDIVTLNIPLFKQEIKGKFRKRVIRHLVL